jgi:hypothetical protein
MQQINQAQLLLGPQVSSHIHQIMMQLEVHKRVNQATILSKIGQAPLSTIPLNHHHIHLFPLQEHQGIIQQFHNIHPPPMRHKITPHLLEYILEYIPVMFAPQVPQVHLTYQQHTIQMNFMTAIMSLLLPK